MPEYRRWYVPGGTFFFTVVTHERLPILETAESLKLLGNVMRRIRSRRPFASIAIVVLPDHLHCIWTLPQADSDYSGRWKRIKRRFSDQWVARGGLQGTPSPSRIRRREHTVWQRRFWEHQVRDEEDLERLVDYIHYNPVKHGYVSKPADWPWSSFDRHVRLGQYPPDWGPTPPAAPNVIPGE